MQNPFPQRFVMTSLRVIPQQMQRLNVLARSQGLTSSGIIRMLVAQYLRRNQKGNANE